MKEPCNPPDVNLLFVPEYVLPGNPPFHVSLVVAEDPDGDYPLTFEFF
jgi:hypothetical protein